MSLVLDALQKQQAAGDPDAAVSFVRAGEQRRRHRMWVGLFALALALNLGLLLWVFGVPALDRAEPASTASTPTSATPEDQVAVPAPVERGSAGSGGSRPLDSVPVRPMAKTEAEPAVQAAAPRAEPESPRVSLEDLPSAVRRRLPGLAFSTHIYAEDADLRAVVANGRRLQEGDRIRGVEILEINEGGVLLAFEGYRVQVPMITDWDAPP
jgi:hypothetical protein